MKTYKVAFIGAGGRSISYAGVYAQNQEIEVVAVMDPNESHRKLLIQRAELRNSPAQYTDWQLMLKEHDDLDGVVICSPNACHADQAVACFEKGLPIALEKPIATSIEDCQRILDAERANNGRSLVGFVLRSTPFYSQIHDLVASGAVGQVLAIEATELVGLMVSSLIKRNAWRKMQLSSGGSMLEKSCHDLDIINWMMQSYPVSLNSYGDKLIFRDNPLLPDSCDQCKLGDTCLYYKEPALSAHEDEGERNLHKYVRDDSSCVYNNQSDIADVQSINIVYGNGAVANFLLSFNCMGPRSGRNIHVIGTKGRVWGNIDDLEVSYYNNQTGETETFSTAGDGSGHGGGDKVHSLKLLQMMKDPSYRPDQDASAGYLSALMCFAADISRTEGRRIDFRHHESAYAEIV